MLENDDKNDLQDLVIISSLKYGILDFEKNPLFLPENDIFSSFSILMSYCYVD